MVIRFTIALQILALFDEMNRVDADKIKNYVANLQQPDGSFHGDKWGEVDTRFSYCAVSILSLLGELHSGAIDLPKAMAFVGSCRNFDGGFGRETEKQNASIQVARWERNLGMGI